MSPHEHRSRIDLAAARYLDALERDDQDETSRLWEQAATDPDLLVALQDTHLGLLEEQAETTLTIGEIARELARGPASEISGSAIAWNERLKTMLDELPADLGLSSLSAWADARYGTAPAGYWRAFRQVALRLKLRRAAETEYQLAARPEGRK